MSAAAIWMMAFYLLVVWGGLIFGAFMMATHRDETAGKLPAGITEFPGEHEVTD